VTIKAILLALLVASLFAYVGLTVSSDLASTYSVTMSSAETNSTFGDIQDKSSEISVKIEQVHEWLQDLTEGDIGGFVFAMPANVANILGIFLQLPNIAYSVFDAAMSSFGIPSFVTGIVSVMIIVTIVLIIVGIWTEGRT
jgi:hypothetical protein